MRKREKRVITEKRGAVEDGGWGGSGDGSEEPGGRVSEDIAKVARDANAFSAFTGAGGGGGGRVLSFLLFSRCFCSSPIGRNEVTVWVAHIARRGYRRRRRVCAP